MRCAIFLPVGLLTVVFCSGLADINVQEFIQSAKEIIESFNDYFTARIMEEERLTNMVAMEAIDKMQDNFTSSLTMFMAFPFQELQTAQMMMAGTSAEGCIAGISEFPEKAINDEFSKFLDCIDGSKSKMRSLSTSLAKVNKSYQTSYTRCLRGIDVCLNTYPNIQDQGRLLSCVDSMSKIYYSNANATQAATFPSPSMEYFKTKVVPCVTESARSLSEQGVQFLSMLVNCASLSSDVNIEEYEQRMNNWPTYVETLPNQIQICQNNYYSQKNNVERDMMAYYSLQKQAQDNYAIQSRGQQYYKNQLYRLLSPYFNTLLGAELDNPGNAECTLAALDQLNALVESSSKDCLACDVEIVAKSKEDLNAVNALFMSINNFITSVGNSAILDIFKQGYVFANNTIVRGYSITLTDFYLKYEEAKADIDKHITKLEGYRDTFFGSGVILPCGPLSGERDSLEAERCLYTAERCMYKNDGTDYAVTTPAPQPTYDPTPQWYPTTTTTIQEYPSTTMDPYWWRPITTDEPNTNGSHYYPWY